jgi:4-hydroxy-tetrahydrodipicolinate synthase
MIKKQFHGTGVALITPFKNGEIDFDALERIIEHVIQGGVDYIISLGTTGEAVNITTADCNKIFQFTRSKVNERVSLVAGLFGGNFTQRLKESFKSYDLEGYSAIMSSSPAYIKPSQEGIYQHYLAIAEASHLPVIIYNVPGRTASNIRPETVFRLAQANKKFVAVKEASGDILQAMSLFKNCPDDFTILSGDDPTALPFLTLGGHGIISVIANVFPHEFSSMVNAAMSGDIKKARHLNLSMHDIHPLLYVEGNPSGIKAAMNIQGLCENELRIPLTPVTEATYLKLKSEIKKMGSYLKNENQL